MGWLVPGVHENDLAIVVSFLLNLTGTVAY